MQGRKQPASSPSSQILIALAGNAMMGVALGLGFSFSLIVFDAFGLGTLIAHSLDPQASFGIFVGTFTLAFAVGATLTGFVLTMMESDERSKHW